MNVPDGSFICIVSHILVIYLKFITGNTTTFRLILRTTKGTTDRIVVIIPTCRHITLTRARTTCAGIHITSQVNYYAASTRTASRPGQSCQRISHSTPASSPTAGPWHRSGGHLRCWLLWCLLFGRVAPLAGHAPSRKSSSYLGKELFL